MGERDYWHDVLATHFPFFFFLFTRNVFFLGEVCHCTAQDTEREVGSPKVCLGPSSCGVTCLQADCRSDFNQPWYVDRAMIARGGMPLAMDYNVGYLWHVTLSSHPVKIEQTAVWRTLYNHHSSIGTGVGSICRSSRIPLTITPVTRRGGRSFPTYIHTTILQSTIRSLPLFTSSKKHGSLKITKIRPNMYYSEYTGQTLTTKTCPKCFNANILFTSEPI